MGYVDIDELMNSKRKNQNLFGTTFDSKTNQYVSFPSVSKATEISSNITDTQKSSPTTQKKNDFKSFRWIAEGNVFPVKEILKKHGMRWDSSDKIWYSLKKPDLNLRDVSFRKKAYKK